MVDLRGSNIAESKLQENLLKEMSGIGFNIKAFDKIKLDKLRREVIEAMPRLKELYNDHTKINEAHVDVVNLNYEKKIPKKVMVTSFFRRGDGHIERFQRIFEKEGWHYQWCAPHKLHEINQKESQYKTIAMVDIDHDYFVNGNLLAHLDKLKNNFDFVIGFAFDGWSRKSNVHNDAVRSCLNLVWCPNIYYELWSNGLSVDNITPFPVPLGIEPKDQEALFTSHNRRNNNIKFSGNIERQSFPRLIWLIEKSRKSDVEFDLSNYKERSKYNKYDSYLAYLKRLAQSKAVINFSTRNDMSRGYTGRPAETIAVKQLLFQEFCPSLNLLYQPGVHFLQFHTMRDFDDIVLKIRSNEDLVREISENAYGFFQQRYSDRRMLEHLTAMLGL